MNRYIDNITHVNNTFVKLLDGLSTEQLNTVPAGFNNNIIWNFAHLLAVQQSVFYLLSGRQPLVAADFIASYRRGTKPEKYWNADEITALKDTFANSIRTLKEDYEKGVFTQYKTYETSMGVVLTNIDDAIQFSTVHDGLHLGYAQALRRLV